MPAHTSRSRLIAVLVAIAVIAPASVASAPSFAADPASTVQTIDGLDPAITYSGAWRTTSNRADYNGSVQYANTAKALYTYRFVGTGIRIHGRLTPLSESARCASTVPL